MAAADLYAEYETWAREHGVDAMTPTDFGRRLGERGLKKKLNGKRRVTTYFEIDSAQCGQLRG